MDGILEYGNGGVLEEKSCFLYSSIYYSFHHHSAFVRMQKTPFRHYEKEFKRLSLSPVLAGSGSTGIISALPTGRHPGTGREDAVGRG